MAGRVADLHHAACLHRWVPGCVVEMRHAARELGYALTTHGTMRFDIDIVCIPWVENARPAGELIPILREACSKITGMPTLFWGEPECVETDTQVDDETLLRMGKRPDENKPHGRRQWSWQLGGGAYVDCSVMPRTER